MVTHSDVEVARVKDAVGCASEGLVTKASQFLNNSPRPFFLALFLVGTENWVAVNLDGTIVAARPR